MTISRQELQNLLRLVGSTSHHEIDCEECLMKVGEVAERAMQGEPVPDDLQPVERHLAICGECREEYDLLRNALGESGSDERPSDFNSGTQCPGN